VEGEIKINIVQGEMTAQKVSKNHVDTHSQCLCFTLLFLFISQNDHPESKQEQCSPRLPEAFVTGSWLCIFDATVLNNVSVCI
jgi:hypothetical protein